MSDVPETHAMRTLSILLATLSLAAPLAQADFSRDLKAAYFFNGNAEDSSGKGQTAQLVGALFTEDRHGTPNSALYLDGSGAYAATPVSGKQFPLSFSFWFRLDEQPGIRPFSLLDSGIGDAFGHAYVIGAGRETFNANLVSAFTYARGKWTHVAVTYGPKLKIYVNGQLVAERDYTEDDSFVAGNFQIGRHFDSDEPRYFHGAIDDVMIFARTLDDEEIQQLHNESAAVEQHIALAAQAKARIATATNTKTLAPTQNETPRPILVVASSAAEPNTNTWHIFDSDENTLWAGAPHQSGWWIAAEFAPPLTFSHLEILSADNALTNALVFYSEDAEEWPALDPATRDKPHTARFLLLTFPAQDTIATPQIRELRWQSE
ncbi:MAG: LamG domain-containing protein [Kiritimatiellae bacterium]|nr:LamG domain-containing protein [Kiritimatiellia bacterium]MCO5069175.1 LamG domain-containing protein [Kiritimatiellia bacterium]